METVKACIFDLDGVIVDTAKYHYTAWKNLANRLGFDFDEVFNEQLKGVNRVESLKLILEKGNVVLNESDFKKALQEKNEAYLTLIQDMSKEEILPGVLNYLILLTKNNIKIGLGSASKNAKMILDALEISAFFDIISDGNMVSKSKPDPEVFLICSSHFGLEPKNCVVFEDSINGLIAAKRGGFQSIGIGDKVTLSMADEVYENFIDKTPTLLNAYSK